MVSVSVHAVLLTKLAVRIQMILHTAIPHYCGQVPRKSREWQNRYWQDQVLVGNQKWETAAAVVTQLSQSQMPCLLFFH